MDQQIRDRYQVVIGLEVHAQLSTASKIFSADPNNFGALPNRNVGVITVAHPGTLPKLNTKVVEQAIKMGIACHGTISQYQIFDRKNYFYPDLPKGYQLTQNTTPIVVGGHVGILLRDGTKKNIVLNRIHLEEDAGKSMHLDGETDTAVDYNRAGVPLIEIVTEPAIYSAEEAGAFLTEVRKLVRYLEICDGNMEEGSLRCDANISVKLKDAEQLGKKVEIKNMNSIRNVQHAIEHEVVRQIELIQKGEQVISETRTFDVAAGATSAMRTKEEMNDYRYFPDPDVSPLEVSDQWLQSINDSMPVLPYQYFDKFVATYSLPEYDAQVLTESKAIAQYFDELCSHLTDYKAASNWMMGVVKAYLKDHSVIPISAKILSQLVQLVEDGLVSHTAATQKIFPYLCEHPEESPEAAAKNMELIQERDATSILPIIESVLDDYSQKVVEYKKGKKGIMGMFMGEVMKRSNGKADPKLTNALLLEKLNEG